MQTKWFKLTGCALAIGWLVNGVAEVPLGLSHDPDLNNDHHVNFLDYSVLLECVGVSSPYTDENSHCELSDFNADTTVDSLDIQIFIDRFLAVFPTTEEASNLFGSPVVREVSGIVRQNAWKDINNDGRLDIYHVNSIETTVGRLLSISVYFGSADLTFGAPIKTELIQFEGHNVASGFTLEDFDGDGILDVFFKELYVQQRVLIFRGLGDGVFDTAPVEVSLIPDVDQRNGTYLVTHLNTDNIPDVIFKRYFVNEIHTFLGNEDLTFEATGIYQSTTTGDYSLTVTTTNFDQDLNPDLIVTVSRDGGHGDTQGSKCLEVFPGIGDGTFADESISFACLNGSLGGPYIADINNDQVQDVVYRDNYWWGSSGIYVAFTLDELLDQTRQPCGRKEVPFLNPGDAKLADINGDGKIDFISLVENSYCAVDSLACFDIRLGNGDGGCQAPAFFGVPSTNPDWDTGVFRNGGFADFNGDGKIDFAGIESASPNIGFVIFPGQ